ncbi:zinc finger CCHC domain-containing protein 7-like [Cimex lectularius]|uniref:Zinc finger CCHC domain-containing protein 7 n=1 Tax=Cimex lectularius TaxID=79782 RepID=A0A8I6SBA9_CIMLE|nr:zinc finger CCHC domain-containing protein 7-like [Cimex lectularius]
MDLIDFEENDYPESEDSSDDELANELYSVIHHNDFSQGIPDHLLEKYDIRFNSENQLEVSLKKGKTVQVEKEESEVLIENRDEVISIYSSSDDEVSVVEVINKNSKRTMKRKFEQRRGNDIAKKNKKVVLLSDDEKDEDLVMNLDLSARNDYENDPTFTVSDIIQSQTDWMKVSSPKNWTEEMKKFYNEPSENLRNFDHKQILKELRKDKTAKWTINVADTLPSRTMMRCRNCRQFGHFYRQCPKNYSSCMMCGHEGHNVNKCPRTMCLNCGDRTNAYVEKCGRCVALSNIKCYNCQRIGHESKNCPDKWRQYHATVSGALNSNNYERNPKMFCCNCGSAGHLDEDCRFIEYKKINFPKISLFVNTYEDGNESYCFKQNSHSHQQHYSPRNKHFVNKNKPNRGKKRNSFDSSVDSNNKKRKKSKRNSLPVNSKKQNKKNKKRKSRLNNTIN